MVSPTGGTSAILHGIPWGQSWEKTYAIMPATVSAIRFPRPTRLVNTGTNMWGKWDAPDSSCGGGAPSTDTTIPQCVFFNLWFAGSTFTQNGKIHPAHGVNLYIKREPGLQGDCRCLAVGFANRLTARLHAFEGSLTNPARGFWVFRGARSSNEFSFGPKNDTGYAQQIIPQFLPANPNGTHFFEAGFNAGTRGCAGRPAWSREREYADAGWFGAFMGVHGRRRLGPSGRAAESFLPERVVQHSLEPTHTPTRHGATHRRPKAVVRASHPMRRPLLPSPTRATLGRGGDECHADGARPSPAALRARCSNDAYALGLLTNRESAAIKRAGGPELRRQIAAAHREGPPRCPPSRMPVGDSSSSGVPPEGAAITSMKRMRVARNALAAYFQRSADRLILVPSSETWPSFTRPAFWQMRSTWRNSPGSACRWVFRNALIRLLRERRRPAQRARRSNTRRRRCAARALGDGAAVTSGGSVARFRAPST